MTDQPMTKWEKGQLLHSLAKVVREKYRDDFLKSVFEEFDSYKSRMITIPEFGKGLQKLKPTISKEEIYNVYQDYLRKEKTNEYIRYDQFADDLQKINKSEEIIQKVFETVLEKYQSGRTNLFDHFLHRDDDRRGILPVKQFESAFNDFGLKIKFEEMSAFIDLYESPKETWIDYQRFEKDLKDFAIQKKGKNLEDFKHGSKSLQQTEAVKETHLYWGQELLNDFNKYLKTKKMKFGEFFEDRAKTHDNFMEPFNFLDCLTKVLGENKREDFYRLMNDFMDNSRQKVNLNKFEERLEKALDESQHIHEQKRQPSMKTLTSEDIEKNKAVYRKIHKEVHNQITKLKLQPIDFFLKHNYSIQDKTIDQDDFVHALNELEIVITSHDLDILVKIFDPKGTGSLDISSLISKDDEELPMTLGGLNDSKVAELIQKLHGHVVKEKVDMFEQLAKADPSNTGFVSSVDLQKILEKIGFKTTPKDVNMLIFKYDTKGDNKFNYKPFLNDLSSSKIWDEEISETKVKQMLKALFNTVMKKFGSIDAFLKSIDKNSDKMISREEFTNIFRNFQLEFSNEETNALFSSLDPKKTNKLMFSVLRDQLQPILNAEILHLAKRIYEGIKPAKSLAEVFGKGVDFLSISKIIDKLIEKDVRLSESEVKLLLEQLSVNRDAIKDTFSCSDFSSALKDYWLEHKVEEITKGPRVGGLSLSSERPQGEILLSQLKDNLKTENDHNDLQKGFDRFREDNPGITLKQLDSLLRIFDKTIKEDSVATIFKYVLFEANDETATTITWKDFKAVLTKAGAAKRDLVAETEWAKTIYVEIYNRLAEAKMTFREAFKSNGSDGKMSQEDVELLLREFSIEINPTMKKLLKEFTFTEGKKEYIDIDTLGEAVHHYRKSEGDWQKTSYDITQELKGRSGGIETIFNEYDTQREGHITIKQFTELLADKLGIKIDGDAKAFINKASRNKIHVTLSDVLQLLKGQDTEGAAEKGAAAIKSALKNKDLVFDDVFGQVTSEHEGLLPPSVFKNKLIDELNIPVTNDIGALIVEYQNQNGHIRIPRLKKLFEDSEAVQKQIGKAVIAVNEAFEKEAETFDSTFMKESGRAGTLSLNVYWSIIESILKLSKKEIPGLEALATSCKQEGNDLIDVGKLRVALGVNTKREEDEEIKLLELVKEIKRLITEGKVDPLQLFKSIDVNNDGTLEREEFISLIHRMSSEASEQSIKRLFRQIDRTRDGKVSFEELIKFLGVKNTQKLIKRVSGLRKILLEIERAIKEQKEEHDDELNLRDIFVGVNKEGVTTLDDFMIDCRALKVGKGKMDDDLEQLATELSEFCGTPGKFEFKYLMECIKFYSPEKAKEDEKKELSHGEVEEICKRIRVAIKENDTTFDKLFTSKDVDDTGNISGDELRTILFDKLYLDESHKMELFLSLLIRPKTKLVSLAKLGGMLGLEDVEGVTISTPHDLIIELLQRFKGKIDDILNHFDVDGNGTISLLEFMDSVLRIWPKLDTDVIKAAFAEFDLGENKEINRNILRRALRYHSRELNDAVLPEGEITEEQRNTILKRLVNIVYHNEGQLLKQFLLLDTEKINLLTFKQISTAFSRLPNKESVSVEELVLLCKYTRTEVQVYDGMVNYVILIENVKKKYSRDVSPIELARKSSEAGDDKKIDLEINTVIRKINDIVARRHIDLPMILKYSDVRGNKRIPVEMLFDELKREGIVLSRDEKSTLVKELYITETNEVNYVSFLNLMTNGYEAMKQQVLNMILDSISERTISELETRGQTLQEFFLSLDKDEDEYWNMRDFRKFIDVLEVKILEKDFERVFDGIDASNDNRISFEEFRATVWRKSPTVDLKALQTKLRNVFLGDDEELDVEKKFSQFSHGTNELSFKDFLQLLRSINLRFVMNEVEALFYHLGKDGKKITREEFYAGVRDPNVNILHQFINTIVQGNKRRGNSLEAFFKVFDADKDNHLTKKEFRNMVDVHDLKFLPRDKEELFDIFDTTHDYRIAYDEFERIIKKTVMEFTDSAQNIVFNLMKEKRLSVSGLFKAYATAGNKNKWTLDDFLSIFDDIPTKMKENKDKSKMLKKNDLITVFVLIDDDRDDLVTLEEFRRFMSSEEEVDIIPPMRLIKRAIEKKHIELKNIFEDFDTDASGFLTYEEFVTGLESIGVELHPRETDYLFNYFDRQQNGSLSYEDFATSIDMSNFGSDPDTQTAGDVGGLAVVFETQRKERTKMVRPEVLDFFREVTFIMVENKLTSGELFKKFDKKKTGTWKLEELEHFIKTCELEVKQSVIKEIFSFVTGSTKADKKITLTEWENAVEAFKAAELKGFGAKIWEYFKIDKKMLGNLFRKADFNRDECLGLHEFITFCERLKDKTVTSLNMRIIFEAMEKSGGDKKDLVRISDLDHLVFLHDKQMSSNFKSSEFGSMILDFLNKVSLLKGKFRRDFKYIFRKYDEDFDECWAYEEFKKLCGDIGMFSSAVSDIFAIIDTRADNKITEDEWLGFINRETRRNYAWMEATCLAIKKDLSSMKLQLDELFPIYKITITRAEFRRIMDKITIKNPAILDQMLEEFVVNDKGKEINLQLFETVYQELTKKKDISSDDISQVAADIKATIEDEGLTFSDLFERYDTSKDGSITKEDFLNQILIRHLGYVENSTLRRFVDNLADARGKITHEVLRENLGEIKPRRGGKKNVGNEYNDEYDLDFYWEQDTKVSKRRRKVMASKKRFMKGGVRDVEGGEPEENEENKLELLKIRKSFYEFVSKQKLNYEELAAEIKKSQDSGKTMKSALINALVKIKCPVTRLDLELLFNNLILEKENGILNGTSLQQLLEAIKPAGVDDEEYLVKKQLVEEIFELFKLIDADKNGFIEFSELMACMTSMGMYVTPQEITKYFEEMDKNMDNLISFHEFRTVMEKKLKAELLVFDDILWEMRNQFRNADITNKGLLTPEQFEQVLKNMGIELKPIEFDAVIRAYDLDRNNMIDMDEFVEFVHNSVTTSDEILNSALNNIRRGQKIGPLQLYYGFRNMPSNYNLSQLREAHKRLENLPSDSIRPKIHPSGMFFTDISREFDSKYIQTRYLIPIPAKILALLSLEKVTGIPTPDPALIDLSTKFVHREAKIAFYDHNLGKFIGNTVIIPASWSAITPDEWRFNPRKIDGENSFYMKLAEYDPNDLGYLSIYFELVACYKQKNDILEMSCAWAALPVTSVFTTKNHKITLHGGAPLKLKVIQKGDVRVTQTGWRYLMQKMAAPVTSTLYLDVTSYQTTPKDIKTQIESLPSIILLNKSALHIFSIFREYLGSKVTSYRECISDIKLDIIPRVMARVVDCFEILQRLLDYWNMILMPTYLKYRSLDFEIKCLVDVLEGFYLLINNENFGFVMIDPTKKINYDQNLMTTRHQLMNGLFEDLFGRYGLTVTKRPKEFDLGKKISMTSKPFSLNEQLEDEEEEKAHQHFFAHLRQQA